ncbi:hypothetical protein [Streptacidiphilus rugosus]|uniref:hypothetical protein n=1 Tax=Streptacidiphilus rugosus TaxID=405783 RepID=UPI0012FAACAF|nr:hypothetical protein [Streptacidiphilus rugosus]
MTENPRSEHVEHHDTPEDEEPLRRRIYLTNLLAGTNWLLLNTDRATMSANGPALQALAAAIEALHEIGWHLNQPEPGQLGSAARHLDESRRQLNAAIVGSE